MSMEIDEPVKSPPEFLHPKDLQQLVKHVGASSLNDGEIRLINHGKELNSPCWPLLDLESVDEEDGIFYVSIKGQLTTTFEFWQKVER